MLNTQGSSQLAPSSRVCVAAELGAWSLTWQNEGEEEIDFAEGARQNEVFGGTLCLVFLDSAIIGGIGCIITDASATTHGIIGHVYDARDEVGEFWMCGVCVCVCLSVCELHPVWYTTELQTHKDDFQ